jgi:hypothetical protein
MQEGLKSVAEEAIDARINEAFAAYLVTEQARKAADYWRYAEARSDENVRILDEARKAERAASDEVVRLCTIRDEAPWIA